MAKKKIYPPTFKINFTSGAVRKDESDLSTKPFLPGKSGRVYFDHAATTPIDKMVLAAMQPYLTNTFGNAASIHSFGQEAVKGIDYAREKVANFLQCKVNEVIFTSGATESNNLAILGLLKAGDHVITSSIEHPAVLEPCRNLSKKGVEVTYVKVDGQGLVNVDDVINQVKPNTKLVTIMYVNNEIGTIQPISEIGQRLRTINLDRAKKNLGKIIFHTDAVQAAQYCSLDVNYLGVDLLSFSGHKIYGPKGVGVLYKKNGVRLTPLFFGGHHEYSLRPGTSNVPGIVGLGKAVELINNPQYKKTVVGIKKLRDRLIAQLPKIICKTTVNGDVKQRVAGNANLSFYGVEGESMLLLLDQKGIAISTGSACSSGSLEPSHVLMALHNDPMWAHSSLRITLGKGNTLEEIDYFIKVLPPIVQKLRKISPIKL